VTGDILTCLRRETAGDHRRLEDAVDLHDVPSPARYRDVLARFLGFYAPLEARLDEAGAGEVLADWPARRKAGWLAGDLALTGLDDDAVSSLPRCQRLPDVTGPARALGSCYVMEGATLGGAMVVDRLGAAAGTPAYPVRFFDSYGGERGRRWHRFRVEVRARVRTPEAEADALAAARETFAAFADWFGPLARSTS